MKWPKRYAERQTIANSLDDFSLNIMPLLGLSGTAERDTFSQQIIASIRREDYFRLIQGRKQISAARSDPASDSFDAELAVVYFIQNNQIDEAAWLIFLMVYLAKPEEGWTRLRDIYGMLGAGRWDWHAVSNNPNAFEQWLAAHWTKIGGKFGNHRKYESLDPATARPMGPAVTHYINWINASGGHERHFAAIIRSAGNHPHSIFDAMFRALPIKGFGRLGRFDWVAMLARYNLIPAEAGSAYLKGATGPSRGSRLLFQGNPNAKNSDVEVQKWLDQLDQHLHVGMEVLEDAICNWQKSPAKFKHFKG